MKILEKNTYTTLVDVCMLSRKDNCPKIQLMKKSRNYRFPECLKHQLLYRYL